jgi:iron complex transport system substrate-binding protein
MKSVLVAIILLAAVGFANASEPMRIISLAPGITEMLYSLGLSDRVIGVTANCDYPPEAMKNEKVGLFLSPNLEKIVSLKPDLVFAPEAGQRMIAKLNGLGVKTVVLPARNIGEILEDISAIGSISSREAPARELIGKMQGRIDAIKKETAALSRPRVLAVVWINKNEVMSAGKKSFINELIALAGGENIAGSVEADYPVLSPEFIVDRNPDIVVLTDPGIDVGLFNLVPAIREINAVKNGRICKISDPNIFLRPGPRLAEGLEEMAKILHPDLAPGK